MKRRKLRFSSLLAVRLKISPRIQPTACPKTVAAAAPAIPISGKNHMPRMRMGSKMMFKIAPVPWEIMVNMVRPVD